MPRSTQGTQPASADLLQPCVSADGAEQVRAATARRDALLARDPWAGFTAPEAPASARTA
jgi:hypothetical protein